MQIPLHCGDASQPVHSDRLRRVSRYHHQSLLPQNCPVLHQIAFNHAMHSYVTLRCMTISLRSH